MSLRTRILLFLFVFALVPLLMAVLINLPLVLDRVDAFYRQLYLHNLRQDFRDLDQHLAGREANVSLLARLPEPALLAPEEVVARSRVDLERSRYTRWVNRILREETDITEIRFLDQDAHQHFWLTRKVPGGDWFSSPDAPVRLPGRLLQVVASGQLKDVAYTPVAVRKESDGQAPALTLRMMAPIRVQGHYRGAAVITVDISDLVRRNPDTLWVLNDGGYLNLSGVSLKSGNAFEHYPGLKELFKGNKPVLWEESDRRMIWVPLFITESGRPLWVGRPADTTHLVEFRAELVQRVLAIVFGLVLLLLVAARVLAKRVEQISSELTQGIRDTLETSQAVRFRWSDTKELRQLSADLTSLSRRHAAQARNLREHTRELENSNRYKSEFLANVSHELRTPLNSILLLSKMLRSPESGLAEEQREQAGVIHKAGGDLRSLIDTILDLSRIEAGQFEMHIEDVELCPLLQDLVELMQPQFDQKGLDLVFEQCDGLPQTIRSDSGKIRQILKNFLANAVKFTQAGEVRLSLRHAPPPFVVELAVSDTGIGIPKAQQARIFEAFQQADGSISRRYGGTGLGLTITRQLADLLQGEIRLRSEPGSGATFSLLLPAYFDQGPRRSVEKAPAEEVGVAPDRDVQATRDELDLAGSRVMLLEAEVPVQLRLAKLFQQWHTRPVLACDPEEARETVEEEGTPHILLFDPAILGDRPCDTIGSLMDGGETALLIGIGAALPLDCDPPIEVAWIDRALEEEDLYRILSGWTVQRGDE